MTMKTRLILAAIALVALPSLASAMCAGEHETASVRCADGKVWDAAQGGCIVASS
jgi:hypothetical protein